MVECGVCSFNNKEKKGPYNVFNRRKSSYSIIKPLDFTISCRTDPSTESNLGI